jgi:glucose/arabinose dehydrogenase
MPFRFRSPRRRVFSRRGVTRPTFEQLEPRHLLSVLPIGFEETRLVSGLSRASAMDFAADGRIFVAEAAGAVRVVKDGTLLAEPFVTVDTLMDVEFGLVGIVLDPEFTSNGYVYVNYTTKSDPPRNVVERFTASGDVAATGSQQTIFQLDELPNAKHHVGGAMHFGTDGMLYIAAGDNNRGQNSQDLGNLHGKILRIDRNGGIPADNPFYHSTTGKNRAIWAYGLRNPFTFGIEPRSGSILINDVGGNKWEEINLGAPGANYGWPGTEGPTSDPRYTGPLYAYAHSSTDRGAAAITGGVFYSPTQPMFPPEFDGKYFFADFNNDWIRVLDPATGQAEVFASSIVARTLDIDVGPDGALYYLAWGRGGSINRIAYTGVLSPVISSLSGNLQVSVGMEARFEVAATGAGTLSYQWQRKAANSATFTDIVGAHGTTYRIANTVTNDDGASYRVVVANAYGTTTSEAAVLTVVPLQPPTVTIVTPAAATTFRAGQQIAFQAIAVDPVAGTLPSSAFSWTAEVGHGVVTRPVTSGVGDVGSFTVPDDMPYKRTDVVVRLTVTAVSPAGLSTTEHLILQPEIGTLSFAGIPAGLPLAIDGEPFTTPHAVDSIVGLRRLVSAAEYRILDGQFYRFAGWSNGGSASQIVTASSAPLALTARYLASPSFFDDFGDGEARHFAPVVGTWLVDSETAYRAAPAVSDGDAISLLPATIQLPREWHASVTIQSDPTPGYYRNGYIVFDYVDPTNFKYAGLRVAAGRWVIGQRTAAGWRDLAWVPAEITGRGGHALRLNVDGNAATIVVGGEPLVRHEFASPPSGGRLGLATERSRTTFDDLVVSRLPLVTPVAGTWLVDSETAYRAAPAAIDGDAISLLPAAAELPRDWHASVTIQSDPTPGYYRNGYIVFDYVDPTNFKYAGLRVAAGRWVIGQRTAAGWNDLASVPVALGGRLDHAIRLGVEGNRATLFVDGEAHVHHVFASLSSQGRLGLATQRGRTTFAGLVVTRLPPLTRVAGTWAVDAAAGYRSAPAVNDGDAIALLPAGIQLPPDWNASVTIQGERLRGYHRNGFIIFDYVDPTNFKYAGLRVLAERWVIGQRTADRWHDLAHVPAALDDRPDHAIRLGVAGSTVTLFRGGEALVNHTFHSLPTGGRIGLATHNARTAFADFGLSSLPFVTPIDGTWTSDSVAAYRAAPTVSDGDAIGLLSATVQLPQIWHASVTIQSEPVSGYYRNGYIIFDYVDPTNFKYAGLRVAAGRWVIGERTADRWRDLVFVPAALESRRDHTIRLGVEGSTATLFSGGEVLVNHTFAGPPSGGRLGLATERGKTSFDDFVVSGSEHWSRVQF